MWAAIIAWLRNAAIAEAIRKYGFQIVKQLLMAALVWVREKNDHPEWDEATRHAKLKEHLKNLDLVPSTPVDDWVIDAVADYFLRSKKK
jgi:hypothetical protein